MEIMCSKSMSVDTPSGGEIVKHRKESAAPSSDIRMGKEGCARGSVCKFWENGFRFHYGNFLLIFGLKAHFLKRLGRVSALVKQCFN